MLHHRADGTDAAGDLPADQVERDRAVTAVRHRRQRRTQGLGHDTDGEIRCAGGRRHTDVGLGGIGLGPLRKTAQVGLRIAHHGRVHREHVRVDRHQRDRREVPRRVVAGLEQGQRNHRHGVAVGQEDRRAVGLGGLERLRGDLPARAGAVLDHDGAAQFLFHAQRQMAGDRVGAAAGGETHQQLDRGVLRPCGAGHHRHHRDTEGPAGQRRQGEDRFFHVETSFTWDRPREGRIDKDRRRPQVRRRQRVAIQPQGACQGPIRAWPIRRIVRGPPHRCMHAGAVRGTHGRYRPHHAAPHPFHSRSRAERAPEQ